MYASRKLIWAVGLGLLVLLASAFYIVWRLQMQVMEETWERQTAALERHLGGVVDRFAEKQFGRHAGDGTGGGSMEEFAAKLMITAQSHPAVLDLAVVTPDRKVVRLYSREGRGKPPCLDMVPLDRHVDVEHPPGTAGEGRIGCINLPVRAGGTHLGSVLVHTSRDWVAQGEAAGETVRRTAMRLAPVFVAFYLLLAALLIVAGRAARRWRLRAASAERVEALGAIADGINHEIRNPLNSVSLSLQFLQRKEVDPETAKIVEQAREQAKRIGDTLEEFVRFTKVAQLKTSRARLGELARSVAGDGVNGEAVTVRGEAEASFDEEKMRDAMEAMFALLEPPVRVDVESGPHAWRLTAAGETSGFDEDIVDRLFDPYVRRSPRDIGRGLAFARAVFQAHGGDLIAHLKANTLTLKGHAPFVRPGEKT